MLSFNWAEAGAGGAVRNYEAWTEEGTYSVLVIWTRFLRQEDESAITSSSRARCVISTSKSSASPLHVTVAAGSWLTAALVSLYHCDVTLLTTSSERGTTLQCASNALTTRHKDRTVSTDGWQVWQINAFAMYQNKQKLIGVALNMRSVWLMRHWSRFATQLLHDYITGSETERVGDITISCYWERRDSLSWCDDLKWVMSMHCSRVSTSTSPVITWRCDHRLSPKSVGRFTIPVNTKQWRQHAAKYIDMLLRLTTGRCII